MNTRKYIFIVAALVIVILAFFYFSNSPVLDPLLSKQLKEQRMLKRAAIYFPNSIGLYSIVPIPGSSVKIETKNMCNKMEDNPVLRETGRTGDACMEIFSATYGKVTASTTSTTTSKTVKVNLSKFTKSAEALKFLTTKSTLADTLDNQPIFRTVPFRLGWLPISDFDMILTEEGELIVSTSTISIKQEGRSLGDDEVTQYFISKYPSKK